MEEINGVRHVSGFFKGADVNLQSTSYAPSFRMDEFNLNFYDNTLQVDSFIAHLNKGVAQISGNILFQNAEPSEYNLELRTTSSTGLSFRIPELAIQPGPVLGQFSILKKKTQFYASF